MKDEREHELVRLLAEHASLGNGKARQLLGWDEATYEQVKQALVAKGQVAIGRGRGGSIALVAAGQKAHGPVSQQARPAPTASDAPVASTHRVDREGTQQEAIGPMANEPLAVYPKRGPGRPRKADRPQAHGQEAPEPKGPKAKGPKANGSATTGSATPQRGPKPSGSAFEQTFRLLDDILRKEAGCSNELDYTEQTSWILFLKYLDDLEATKQMAAELEGKAYTPILGAEYRWPVWACPKNSEGKIDHHKALSGPDLVDFVDQKLFPYLRGFKQRASGPNTIEYKIGEIFGELTNKVKSGYNLREILEAVDALHFQTSEEKHELSELYEGKIQRMGNAGRNGGEYYTPRPLIRAIVQVLHPRIGETVYDGAAGSAGFLCEAFAHMQAQARSTADHQTLQQRTFYAKEKKGLAYIIGLMNMILHGIEAPNIVHTNTLAENLQDIQPKDQHDVVLANPPFGGKERPEVQQNFPIKTGETAFLFLQHFIKSLKAGGRAGIVIKNTFLSNTDNASISLRRKLLEECDLHTILDMPQGTFQGAGVKTVVLFFEKGRPTRRIWYYQLDPGRSLGKTNPLNEADLADFVQLAKTKADSVNSWSVDVGAVNTEIWDLSVKNPSRAETVDMRKPGEILKEIRNLDEQTMKLLATIQSLLS